MERELRQAPNGHGTGNPGHSQGRAKSHQQSAEANRGGGGLAKGNLPQRNMPRTRIINTVLEKDRQTRYQHADDMPADLKRLRRDTDSGESRAHGHPGVAPPHDRRPQGAQ